MGVSHRYRLLSVRGPRMVMRARRGAALLLFLVPYWTLARLISELKLLLHAVTSRRPHAFHGSS